MGQMELGDTPAARRALSAAEADLVSNPALHLFRALLCCDLGEWELARKDWWAARNLSPANQAVPTVQALLYLGERRLEEALNLLCPEDIGKVFDLTVSPPVLGRLVVALEKRLLPLELPESLETEVSPPEPEPPVGAAWLLMRRGRKRLEAAWALPVEERAPMMRLALAEIRAAHEQDPKAFRASYHLGEALLSVAEYDRDRDQRPGPRTVALVKQAQECFEESRRSDGTNPYVLHYLARCALLLRRFELAQELWREALDGFEKFPEAHYGLGQSLLARGREREGRAFLLSAILSDLHLLRDRIRELARFFRACPELFAEPASFPLWEAPADPLPEAEKATDPPPEAEKTADPSEDPVMPPQSSDRGEDLAAGPRPEKPQSLPESPPDS
jgi:tetratricopeptide (TPR) repeat protein